MGLFEKLKEKREEERIEWVLAAGNEEKQSALKWRYFTRASINAVASALSMVLTGYLFANRCFPLGGAMLPVDGAFFWRAYDNMCKYFYWKKLFK